MTVMQYFGALLMLFAHSAVPSPLIDINKRCKLCPPGQYQKFCEVCEDCPEGTYTNHLNSEPSCHSCFKDCRPEFHLQEESRCTSKSNVRCQCQSGFECSDSDGNTLCTECVKLPEPVTQDSTLISVRKNQTEISSLTVGAMSTSCHPPKRCGGHLTLEDNNTHPTSATSKYTAAMLGSVLVIGIIAIVLLSYIRRPTEETCFKQAVKLCNEGVRDASPHMKDSSHPNKAGGPSSAKHHQPSAAVANMGPVHVHSAGGTVIFSLLTHFTGQGESASEGKKRPPNQGEEENQEGCPVFHPTPSPNTHLSQEEGNKEVDQVFFPSQEQGKDCHISKEEVL